jgi:hypothetical protein
MRVDSGERHFLAFGGIMAFDGATGQMTLSGQVFGPAWSRAKPLSDPIS